MSLQIQPQLIATVEAFGPYCIYYLSRGLTLDIKPEEAYLQGGSQLYKAYKIFPESSELAMPADAITYNNLVKQVETEVGVRVVAFASKLNRQSELNTYIAPSDFNR